jgi:hypothetical protein
MKIDKAIIYIVILSFAILGVGVYSVSRMESTPKIETSNKAKASIDTTNYNWGDIKIDNGSVKKNFNIKNTGTEPLQLANIKTSCMCTTARITVSGEKSPAFGMHSKSSWVGEIKPAERAVLEVIFDPAFHGPSGIGPISREVIVETNDPNKPRLAFTLTANVIN